MELLKALETHASTVTTLPRGMARLKATWFTEAVTVTLLECLRAAILAARSIRAKSSPPKRLFNGLVSLGKTKSVIMVRDSFGVFTCMCILYFMQRYLQFFELNKIYTIKLTTWLTIFYRIRHLENQ